MKTLAVLLALGCLSGCNCDRDCDERPRPRPTPTEVSDCPNCRKRVEVAPIPAVKKLPEPKEGPK